MPVLDRKALHSEREAIKAEGEKILAKIKSDQREATDEEMAKLQEFRGQVEIINAKIEKADQLAALDREMAPMKYPQEASWKYDGDKPPHRTHEFKSLDEFAVAVMKAYGGSRVVDERLYKYAAPSSPHKETHTDEGFMVPQDFKEEIWALAFNDPANLLLTLIDLEPTTRNSVGLLTDITTPWGAAGITAKWRGEATQMTETSLNTVPKQVQAHSLYVFTTASDELLEDAPRLRNRLGAKAAEAIGWKLINAIVNGTGAGQPEGYLNSGSLVTQAKVSGQAADTVVAGNVAQMFARLLPGSMARALWLCNSDVIPQLLQMTLGQNSVFVPPATGFQNAPGGFLFGRPVVPSEVCATLGDANDLHLIDPRGYYAINKAGGTKFDSSMHLYFDYGVEAFRWMLRFGGQAYLDTAISPANGNTTKSHFVVLAERAT